MPRTTAKSENKRKQYKEQDSFRWSTPSIDVAARTVDAFEHQGLQKIQAPSNAGNLTPRRDVATIAPMKATERTAMRAPIHGPTSRMGADYSGIQAFLSIAKTATGVADKMGQQQAMEATVRSEERIANGEDWKTVIEEENPEGIFGIASTHYERTMGQAMRDSVRESIDQYTNDPANLMKTTEEFEAGLKGVYSDYSAGRSTAFKQGLGLVGSQSINAAKTKYASFQTAVQQEKQLQATQGMVNEKMEFIQQYAAENGMDPERMARDMVTDMQQKNALWGIPKEKTTAAILQAQENYILNNPTAISDPSSLTAWTQVKDKDGISVIDNPTFGKMVRDIETKHGAALDAHFNKIDKEYAFESKQLVKDIESDMLEAVKSGKKFDSATIDTYVQENAVKLGYKGIQTVEAMHKSLFSPHSIIEDTDLINGWELAKAKQDFEHMADYDDIDQAFADGKISYKTRIALTADFTRAASVNYKEQAQNISAHYRMQGDPSNYINPDQEKALYYLKALVEKEGDAPSYLRMSELVKETKDWMKDQVSGESIRTILTNPQLTGEQKFEKFQLLNKDFTRADYEAHLVDVAIEMDSEAKLVSKARVKQQGYPNIPKYSQPTDDNVYSLYTEEAQKNSLNDMPAQWLSNLNDMYQNYINQLGTDVVNLPDNVMAILEQLKDAPIIKDYYSNQETLRNMNKGK